MQPLCGWGHREPHQQQGSCMSILSSGCMQMAARSKGKFGFKLAGRLAGRGVLKAKKEESHLHWANSTVLGCAAGGDSAC